MALTKEQALKIAAKNVFKNGYLNLQQSLQGEDAPGWTSDKYVLYHICNQLHPLGLTPASEDVGIVRIMVSEMIDEYVAQKPSHR